MPITSDWRLHLIPDLDGKGSLETILEKVENMVLPDTNESLPLE